MPRPPAALLALLLIVVDPALARADRPLVVAAASLTDALQEVALDWRSAGGTEVDFSFGGSGDLARQVERGGPADVFFSADEESVDRLDRAGLVDPETRRDVLSNRLAVVVPAGSAARVGSAADLAAHARVALADPEFVPVGAYARRWLERAGAWDEVRPRVVPLLDARAALAAVSGGHAPVGVVFATDAASTSGVRVALEVPRDETPPIVYPLVVLRGARHPRARELADFLASPRAMRIYERHGFAPAAPR